jgi:hypothetical protein
MRLAFCSITIRARGHQREIIAPSEREAALMAEDTLRQFEEDGLLVGYWIDCSDAGARGRIAAYLSDLAFELA